MMLETGKVWFRWFEQSSIKWSSVGPLQEGAGGEDCSVGMRMIKKGG